MAPLVLGTVTTPKSIAGIVIPDSALAKDAMETAESSERLEIFRHSLRTFLFAELIAQIRHVQHDSEAVFVASILHDTGLVPQFMSADERFEVDGANLSRAMLARHQITGLRSDVIWDAVCLHDQGDIAKWKQPEVQLVSAGVSADFGAGIHELPRDDVVAILRAAPRDNFIPVFLDAVAQFARRKPDATGNSWVTDVAYRRVRGFHLDNFVDAVTSADPFSGY
ncbi:MAG: HD domain-containing protein [Candidatus Eremiobacteraeota bacterium]|nr:HD domain-containing protein [Candidatus Eremiobacteraeota bacterium]MBV8372395.1 HD domain-containing protein [Candidatus Eremiobacteraeota bacterium]